MMTTAAFAGYGDVSLGGYPSWAERDVHIWTNMVRVDPDAFYGPGNEWGASCGIDDFVGDESVPKLPLYYDLALNDAGRFHSQDMWENNHFSHASSDGTSFGERMSRFYFDSGYVGENIAAGYPDAVAAVLFGWMCSPGHRANIMNGDYNELGTGVVATYYTQDFAAGLVETGSRMAMGNHSPEKPTDEVEFFVDYQGPSLDAMEVILDGEPTEMELTYGSDASGVYTLVLPLDPGPACHEYYFSSSLDGEQASFPEDGSYLFGADCDEPLMWIDEQARPSSAGGDPWTDDDEKVAGIACASAASGGAAPMALLVAVLGMTHRRRRTPTRPIHRLQ